MSRPPNASQSDMSSRVSSWAQAWAHLRAGKKNPSFDAVTEREFRGWYQNFVRGRVRASGWMPLVTLMLVFYAPGPFADLREAWFGVSYPLAIEIIRFGIVLPTTLVFVAITYSNLYQRFYLIAAQIVAPLHATCFIAMDVMMRPQGYSLGSWLVLVVLGSYFMYGLLLHQGIRNALTILAIYAAMGVRAGLDTPQWRMDLAATAFAAVFAGYVFFSLHRAVRINYLDHRRLTDHLNRDALTGIHNRRLFDEQVKRLWQQGLRDRIPL
ncbi:MAG TPA: hypothetical protein VK629_07320, partial [Steroidobacteraceae bacterium]|nr:hypothetical protein [Steroidobacteraceae bacterium]